MVNLSPAQLSFNAGEWSKRLWGRSDLAKYAHAARRCENFIPLVQGPLTKRPGFRHVAPLRDNAAAVRLIPFVYAEDQAYVIEATPGAFRFYRNGAPILEAPKAVSAIAQSNPAAVSATAHGYATGDEVVVTGAAGMVEIEGRRATVTVTGPNGFTLDAVDATGFGVYGGGASVRRVYQVAQDYDADELAALKWVQSLDLLLLLCPGRRPKTLGRYGETDWRFEQPDFDDGPYLSENVSETAISSVNPLNHQPGDLVTLQFSDRSGINGDAGFGAADVGRQVRWLGNSTGSEVFYRWAVGRIEIVDGPSTVRVRVTVRQQGSTLSRSGRAWRLGAWSDLRGWPTCGAFYKGRLWLANSAAHPESLWASTIDDYFSFAPSPLERPDSEGALPLPTAANALFLTTAGEEASLIRWLQPLQALALGTASGEKSLRGSNLAEAITPDNAAVLPASSVGVADILPARIDGALLYVSRDRARLYELSYSLESDGYRSPEMTLLAGHLGEESPFAEIVFQRRPWRSLWARRDDGLLVGFTYDREQEVTAWHRHPLGGEQARVLSLAVIPGAGEDQLWIAAERQIGGLMRRTVERLDAAATSCPLPDASAAFHLDAGLTYQGTPTAAVHGLEHLEGAEVAILADGAVHPPRIVTAGRIVLERPAACVHVGLAFASRYESLNLEAALAQGSSLGRPKTLTGLELFFLDSLGGAVGPDEAALEPVLARRDGQAMDAPPPLATGVQRLEWRGGWRREKRVFLRHDQPLPFTLAGLAPRLSVNEG